MEAQDNGKIFKAAIEAIADGLLLVDTRGAIISFNQPYVELFNLPQSVLDLRDDHMTLAFVQGQMRNPDEFLAASKEEYANPERESQDLLEFTDGRIIERTSQPLRVDGAVAGRVWTYHVVSAKSTRFAEQRYRVLIEQAIVGIYVIQDGFFVYVNPRMLEMYGHTLDEMMALPVLEFIAPEDRKLVSENIRKRIEGTISSIHYSLRIRRKDGSIVPTEVHGSRIMYNQKPAILGMVLDLSERERTQEALERTELQLRQAQKMEAIGQFAGGIAHDFNNLLTVINGYSQMVLDRMGPGDLMRRELELICSTGERAATLVQKLLAFSRRQMFEPKLLDVNAIVMDMQNILRRLVRANINISTILQPDLCSVISDESHLEQIVMNLVVNARDAISANGTISIQTRNIEIDQPFAALHAGARQGKYVLLAVIDNGTGMTETVKSRIFEPFFTTKGTGDGTGLGLASVYGIVKQHHGFIEVESEIGVGSAFKVYLPATSESPNANGIKQPAADIARGTETVLLVEDDEAVRSVTNDILDARDYFVLSCKDSVEALARCEHYDAEIHLLLTDMVMPGMDGLELAKRIRIRRPEIKVLFMSGYTEHGMRDLASVPNSRFLLKPFTPNSLGETIRELLDSTPGKGEFI